MSETIRGRTREGDGKLSNSLQVPVREASTPSRPGVRGGAPFPEAAAAPYPRKLARL